MAQLDAVTHIPVLCRQAADALLAGASRQAVLVDATFGGGGHSAVILREMPPAARLLALDCDESAAKCAAAVADPRFCFHRRNFCRLDEVLQAENITGIDGALFDLGVSSFQLDAAERGFSFQQEGELDMRMDRRQTQTAKQWLMDSDEADIAAALRCFGEEPESKKIARALASRRGRLFTTLDVARLVSEVKQRRHRRHPATRVFQALRIAVNRELESLQKGLAVAADKLVEGGRLAVIAFHSLEDRIVKKLAVGPSFPGFGRLEISALRQLGDLIRPDAAEIAANPRSRSARLRVFVKTGGEA